MESCFLIHSAAMMGLMLHAKAKSLIETDMYVDALEVLAMAEVRNKCFFFLCCYVVSDSFVCVHS